jgi:copper chaperone CopZ
MTARESTSTALLGEARRLEFAITGTTCVACAASVAERLNSIAGVQASVNVATGKASVAAPATLVIGRSIDEAQWAGNQARLVSASAPEMLDDFRVRYLHRRLIVALLFFVPLSDLSILLSLFPVYRFPGWQWALVALAIPVAGWAARPFHSAAACAAHTGDDTELDGNPSGRCRDEPATSTTGDLRRLRNVRTELGPHCPRSRRPVMSRRGRLAGVSTAVAAAMLAAGCASGTAGSPGAYGAYGAAGRGTTGEAGTRASLSVSPLTSSLASVSSSWAVVLMGGSAAEHNNFWELFSQVGRGGRWRLITPPGVADNGGLVVAPGGGRSLFTAFRPSQGLTYTPLIETRDAGTAWSSLNPLDAALGDTPDSLAAQPPGGPVLALTTGGTAELAAAAGGQWHTLARRQGLARTPAGSRCGVEQLTAVAFTAAGRPLVAGSCFWPGFAGIFAERDGTWHGTGPRLPRAVSSGQVSVLRLTRTGGGLAALLTVRSGRRVALIAAWANGAGTRWTLSAPLRLDGRVVTGTSFGPGSSAAVVLSGSRGYRVAGPGSGWQLLPPLPPGTSTLAAGLSGTLEALAVHRTRLAVWQLDPRAAAWHQTQLINVPIPFGSSS